MYTESQLKEWISERLPKGTKSLSTSIRNSKIIQESLYEYTKQYDNLTFSARANIIYHANRPVCTVCGNFTYFNRNRWDFGETCSVKCAANNERRIKQIKQTNIERYGVDNITKTKFFKEYMKTQNLEKYGVEYYMQSEDFKSKSKKTNIEKYGNGYIVKTQHFKSKSKKTNIEKYGKEHYSMTEEFKNKVKETSLKRYGCEHHMQFLEVFEKQQKNSYYYKIYKFPSGNEVKVQGYEPMALDILLKKYTEEDIITSDKEIFRICGSFEYIDNDKKRRYYPDIYLPNENKIIEVKSIRTFELHKKINMLKKDSIISKGYHFEFWIFNKNELIII